LEEDLKMSRRTTETDHVKKVARRLRRGSMPHNARQAGVRFEKGHAKRGGRKKGVPNLLTGEAKDLIYEAAVRVGSDGEGEEGALGYLIAAAKEERKAYLSLFRAVIPTTTTINASIRQERRYMTEAEVLAFLEARGLPRLIFKLRYHEVPAADVGLYCEDGKAVALQPVKPPADEEK
jgi:hypothetical protein